MTESIAFKVANLLGFSWRVIDANEFWNNHPICPREEMETAT